MSENDKVIQMSAYHRQIGNVETSLGSRIETSASVEVELASEGSRRGDLLPEDFLDHSDGDSLLQKVLPVLDEALEDLQNSLAAKKQQSEVAADDYLQGFISKLPELFDGRALGDGYGAVVLGMFHALKNSSDEPLNLKQTQSLFDAASTLRREPYISDGGAVDLIIDFETAGLVPYARAIETITEALEEVQP